MGVYLGESIYNDSQVTQEWVEDEIEKNGKGVFFAIYDETTYQSILQEYNNGKIIVCKYQPVTPGETTTYYFNLVRFNTETFDFVGVMQDGTIYRTGVNVNEGWANVTSFKSDEIEFVEYNVDSYTTIKSYYDDGKFIVLKYLQQTPLVTKYYFYPLVSVDETNKEIIFGSLELGQNNKKITFTVTDSTGWAAPVQSSAVVVDAALDSSSHNPVENMAIAAELTAINNKITGDLNDIFLALASKGVTVPAGAGLDDVAGLIEDVPTGGADIPSTYKQIMYVEFNGSAGPKTKALFYSQEYTDKIYSIDTIEIDFYLPNLQWVIDNSLFLMNYNGSWSGATGYAWIDSVQLNTIFQEYRELNISSMNNLDKFISYKKSARRVRSGDVVPSGYDYVAQVTVNGELKELNQYGDLQPINNYDLRNLILFDSSSPNSPGTKIFKIKFKEFETERVKGDFIPCIRVSDSKPGFYEPNLDIFLTPYNSNAWDAGPIIS